VKASQISGSGEKNKKNLSRGQFYPIVSWLNSTLSRILGVLMLKKFKNIKKIF